MENACPIPQTTDKRCHILAINIAKNANQPLYQSLKIRSRDHTNSLKFLTHQRRGVERPSRLDDLLTGEKTDEIFQKQSARSKQCSGGHSYSCCVRGSFRNNVTD